MFGRHQLFVPALVSAKESGLEVKIICYFREHVSWSLSAYEQWALKHKSYGGKIKSYRQYFSDNPISFAGNIKPWMDAFEGSIELRNFDCRDDVVNDFFEGIGISEEPVCCRINEKMGSEELLARAVFNNMLSEPAVPLEFTRSLKVQDLDIEQGAAAWIRSLLPSQEDVEWLRQQVSLDLDQLNRFLALSGEPPWNAKGLFCRS